MSGVSFDTYELVKELVAAGFTDAQAEAVTRAVRDARSIDLSSLATKADLQAGLGAAHSDLAAATSDLQRSIAETKADILKWLIGAIGVQMIVIIGAVLTLMRMGGKG